MYIPIYYFLLTQIFVLLNYLYYPFAGIATVIMNKPPVNCISLELLDEINSEINKLQKDNIRGMILTSVRVLFLNIHYTGSVAQLFCIYI